MSSSNTGGSPGVTHRPSQREVRNLLPEFCVSSQ